MTVQDAQKAFEELKAQGNSEEDILGVLYTMFQDDAIDFDELESFAKILGYEITDEFRNMSPEDQKTKGYEPDEDSTDASAEEIDDAKEFGDSGDSSDSDSDSDSDDSSDEEDSESDDERAARLFGFGK